MLSNNKGRHPAFGHENGPLDSATNYNYIVVNLTCLISAQFISY